MAWSPGAPRGLGLGCPLGFEEVGRERALPAECPAWRSLGPASQGCHLNDWMDRELEKDRFPKNFAADAWTRAVLLLKPGGREPEEVQVPIEAEKQKHWAGEGRDRTETRLSHIPAEVPSAPHSLSYFSPPDRCALQCARASCLCKAKGPSRSAARCVKAASQLSHGGPPLVHTLWPVPLPGEMQMSTAWQVNRALTALIIDQTPASHLNSSYPT